MAGVSEISPAPDAVPSLSQQLTDAVGAAISAAYPEQAGADPLIRPSDHADLQANAALALAKKVGANPREVGTKVSEQITAGSAVGKVEISGPGFLNLTISDETLWNQVEARRTSARLGVPATQAGVRTVIDYSGPNIAKEMHVGHIRSTVIGDALTRVLSFLGSEVIKQNHLGDWGTQFGMLIQYITEHPEQLWRHSDLAEVADATTVSALDSLYKAARKTFDADEAFADRARARVVALQAGDSETLAVWREIVAESQYYFDQVYARLGILLRAEDSRGESSYNDQLDAVAAELEQAGIAVTSDGALVVLSEDVKGPDDQPAALMVRKRDGVYGYDTTDLATLKYRISELEADRILYLVDARQTLHFRLLFEAGRRAGWLTEEVDARHISFGSILGPDGKPFKTRSGETVRLMDLLDMAVDAAATVVREGAEAKGSDLDEAALTEIAEQAGIGAVKYADLSGSRTKDYVFDPERMTAFNGNTGVYLQYAHTRMVSILRRAASQGVKIPDGVPSAISDVALEPAERALVLAIDGLGDVLAAVAEDLEPHRLTTYLYELARAFTDFYEACPVLPSSGSVRERRLALVDLTRRTLSQGLDLLGIAAPERM